MGRGTSGAVRTLLLCAVLAGCTTYDASRYYDAAASEQAARIVEKRKFSTKAQPAADSKTNMAFIPIPHGGGLTMVALSITVSREAIIDVYEYTVEAADGKRVAVYNDFPALEVEHCVTLFTSPKPSYPRISPVGRCPGR